MDFETLLLTRDGATALLTVNRPDKLNALNATVLEELARAFTALAAEAEPVRALVLTGAGSKAFVAGADIAAMSAMTPEQALAFSRLGHRVGHLMEAAPFPVIAAVNGFALGGGCELALAADFIYASSTAKFGQPEVNLGLMPGFGGTQRLARRVGAARARELIYSAATLDAAEALRLGLVNRVLPSEELLPAAQATAAAIAGKGPLAVAASKRALLDGADLPLPAACEVEAAAFAGLFGSEDQREGTRAFLEKRPARFGGR